MEANDKLTVKEAYESMIHMLYNYWKLTGSENLIDILGPGVYLEDGMPADSVFWKYWIEAVEQVKKGEPPIFLELKK